MLAGGIATSMSTAEPGASELETALGSHLSLTIFGLLIGWSGITLLYAKARRYRWVEHDAYLVIAMLNFFVLMLEWFIFSVPVSQWLESAILLALSVWLYLRN